MQTVLVECNGVPISHATDPKAHVSHGKMTMSDVGEKEIMLLPISRARRQAMDMLLYVVTNQNAVY